MSAVEMISYKELLDALKAKGKEENWFDTMRTRHKFVHTPIMRSPRELITPNAKRRQGRDVYYLRQQRELLEEIIRLHDEEGKTYPEIRRMLNGRTKELFEEAKTSANDKKKVMPVAYWNLFRTALVGLKNYYGWSEESKELVFYRHVYKERFDCGARYQICKDQIRQISKIQGSNSGKVKELLKEKDRLGLRVEFSQAIILDVIKHFSALVKERKICMSKEEFGKDPQENEV
ncbi:MAG: hypothetical protein HQL24_09495 [Candidatus Omnitrophica bacterium]|nr:hypothetical protein [Candidatus Omnitrophota bacterium]